MDTNGEIGLRDPPILTRKRKYITTFSIYLGNIAFGTAFPMYGPALVDLKNKYDTTIDEMSLVVTILTIFYLIGGLTTGFAYNFINRQLGVAFIFSGVAVSMFLTPHCPSLSLLFGVAGLLGFCVGAYDASQVVWVMEMWQAEAGPYIQAQHFFNSVGGLLAPLLLAPFLASEEGPDGPATALRNPYMYVPFTVVGGIATTAAGVHFYLFTFKRYVPPPLEEGRIGAATSVVPSPSNVTVSSALSEIEQRSNGPEPEEIKVVAVSPKRDYLRLQLIILSAVFLGADTGMEICTGAFLSTFAQYGALRLSQREGAYLMTGLTGALIAGRGAGILVILKIQPQFLLCFNLVAVVAANLILVLFGGLSAAWLWAGAIGMGLGFSTIVGSYTAYIERHLLYTNGVGAVMCIAGSSVAAVYPIIIGKFIERDANVMVYTNFASLLCIFLAGIFIFRLTYKRNRSLRNQ